MGIEKIGIELEGGWAQLPESFGDIPMKIIADLSIDGRTMETDSVLYDAHVGEIVSPPLLLSEWKGWIRTYYPDSVNITCGIHVHLSVTTKKEYATLMSKGYERRVIAGSRAVAERLSLLPSHYIWDRLNGLNPFAHFNVIASEQVGISEKRIGMRARYAALNFCYSMHGTLEYRVLPMFKEGVDVAEIFIENFLSVTKRELEVSKPTFSKGCALGEEHGQIVEIEREAI